MNHDQEIEQCGCCTKYFKEPHHQPNGVFCPHCGCDLDAFDHRFIGPDDWDIEGHRGASKDQQHA